MYLFEQFLQYLNEYYFSASLGSYDNFEIHSVVTLAVIIGGLCLGLFLSSVISAVHKKHIGKMVRSLLSLGADSPQTSKTLAELGLSKSVFVKMSLNSASALRKLLTVVEGDKVFTYLDELAAAYPDYKEEIEKKACREKENGREEDGEKKVKKEKNGKKSFFEKGFRPSVLNFETARFFIDPSLSPRASVRYKEKGSSWWTVLLSFFLSLILFFLALRFLPVLVSMFDATISNLKGL